MKNKYLLYLIYGFELLFFTFVIMGVLPREAVLYLVAVLALYVLTAKLEDSVIFFVISIPFFIAIPLTPTFDSLNTWRVISLLILLKWAFIYRRSLLTGLLSGLRRPWKYLEEHRFFTGAMILLIIAIVSVIPAVSNAEAIRRVIYFLNLCFVPIVLYALSRNNAQYSKAVIRSIPVPIILVTVFGFIQLIMTYYVDVYQFMRIWGEGVQCRQYGFLWCDTAVQLGNTWLAYYGELLSLRVFSVFPDTHSFPIFLLLGLSALYATTLRNFDFTSLKDAIKKRSTMLVIWIPLVFLIMILTGTRGILAAGVGVLLFIAFIRFAWKKTSVKPERKNILRYITVSLLMFVLLFVVAQPIFSSRQFRIPKDANLLSNRLRSILDFGETSNAARIQIWKASIVSISERPFLGVGISNFPVVLNEDTRLTKAGSSAHNVYLHIASEMGIPALLVSIWLMLIVLWKANTVALRSKDKLLSIYSTAVLVFIPWVLIYSLTDFALFDGRAFSLFLITIALVLANYESQTTS